MAFQPKDSAFLKQARERFQLADEADSDQAQRERDDIAFEDGDQWPADVLTARQGQQANDGMPVVPARPTLVINKVRRSVQQVLNQERQSDIGVEIVPADDFGDLGITPDDTEIALREGLTRRIQRESQAADARSWAFKRACIAGRGYYMVLTRYLPGSFDQEVYVHRIYNQAGVLLDPSHEQPDGSDAEWEFVGTWVPWDKLKARYPKLADGRPNPLCDCNETDFVAQTEAYPKWYRQSPERVKDGQTQPRQYAVRVVDYYYADHETVELALLSDGRTVPLKDAPPNVAILDRRFDVKTTIRFCKIAGGFLELEKTELLGPDMPIVKVLGEEILPYDEQRRAEGMVRQARSSQQGLNYMISKQVETVGLTPIAPLMVDPDAIDGHEAFYQQMNTRTFGYLPYRTFDEQSRPLAPPTRPPVTVDNIGLAQSIALFDQAVQDTTAVSDPALGETNASVKSDRHARTLIEEARMATSNFIDNLARSVRYEGQIINNLLYPVYGSKPGRLVRTITGSGEAERMRIGDPQQQQQAMAQQHQVAKVAKLTEDAKFNVIVKVSKATTNRRQQFVMQFGDILSADPNQMLVAGDLFYRNMDIPESRELAERMRVMLAPPVQQMLAAKEQGQNFDPVAQAKIAELEQRVQMAEQAMQELHEEARGKRLESETKLKVAELESQRDVALAQLEAQKELELQRMKSATEQYKADVDAKTKGQIQAAEHAHDEMATATQLAHEAEQKGLDREAQANLAAHDAAIAEGQADRQEAEGERGRQFEAGQKDADRAVTMAENERNRQAASEQGE